MYYMKVCSEHKMDISQNSSLATLKYTQYTKNNVIHSDNGMEGPSRFLAKETL